MKYLFAAALIFNCSSAIAQQQSNLAIDRISVSLGQCISQAEQKVDIISELQKQLQESKEKIKQLEDKK